MPKKEKSYTIGFRINGRALSKLEKLASAKKISVHEQARRLFLDALENETQEEIKNDVKRGREEMEEFKMSVASAFEALLVKVGNVERETAKDWITETFRKR